MNLIDHINTYKLKSMAGNIRELPTTVLKTNREFNANWNISDGSLGMLPKTVAQQKSCAAEHTASIGPTQYRSCAGLVSENPWLASYESNGIGKYLGSGNAGIRFSTGSIGANQVRFSQNAARNVNGATEELRNGVLLPNANDATEELQNSNVFLPNNADRSRTSSVPDINSCEISEHINVMKRRKSSFQITSITVPDRSKVSSSEFLDSWDSVEDMLSNPDDTGSENQDTSQGTIDFNENAAVSFDTGEVVQFGEKSYGISVFFPQSIQDSSVQALTIDAAATNIANLADASSVFTALTSVLPRTDISGVSQSSSSLILPSILTADASGAFESSKASDKVVEGSKPVFQMNEIHSRFKIVKFLNRIRGRWKCTDCIGLPMSIAECTSPKTGFGSLCVSEDVKDAARNSDDTVKPIPFVCSQESHFVQHPLPSAFSDGSLLSTSHGIESYLHEGLDRDEMKRLSSDQSNSDNVPSSTMSYVVGLVPLSAGGAISSSSDSGLASGNTHKSSDIIVFLPQMCQNVDEMLNSPSVVKVSNCDSSAIHFQRNDENLEADVEAVDDKLSEVAASLDSDSLTESTVVKSAGSLELDNKIEQAMDLVKTHLMFAVHEEVELLKIKIKELMQKNSRLEYENNLLRVSADPEMLTNLSSNFPQFPPRTGHL